MLQPKKVKFRKQQKMRNRGIDVKCSSLSNGEFGLKAITRGRITSRQLEASRRAIKHHVNREGKLWINIFPDKPISKKPLEVRMGKGKGSVEYWVAQVRPGKIIYEISGVSLSLAKSAFLKCSSKLPIITRFIEK